MSPVTTGAFVFMNFQLLKLNTPKDCFTYEVPRINPWCFLEFQPNSCENSNKETFKWNSM